MAEGMDRRESAIVVYDWDGTIVDSEPVIRQAYLDAGAPSVPDDFMKLTWVDWLVPQVSNRQAVEIHDRKDELYAERIGDAPALPSYFTAIDYAREGNIVGLLTGSPWSSIPGMRRAIVNWPFVFAVAGLRIQDKVRILAQLGRGTYVDDIEECREPVESIGWTFNRAVRWAGT